MEHFLYIFSSFVQKNIYYNILYYLGFIFKIKHHLKILKIKL